MNDVVGVDDTAGNEERVDLLLKVLVALEDVTEVCETREGGGRSGEKGGGKAGLASGKTRAEKGRTEHGQSFRTSDFFLKMAKLVDTTARRMSA